MPIIKDEELRKEQSNYWHPVKGATERWKSSWNSNKNPIKAVLDSGLGYLVPGLNIGQTIFDAKRTLNELRSNNGIKKTLTKAKEGDYKGAVKSGTYDFFNLLSLWGSKVAFNNLQERGRAAVYRNKNPFGYKNNVRSDKTTWQELGDAAKEFLNFSHLDTKGVPKYRIAMEKTGDVRKLDSAPSNINGEARMELRDAAYRKYLNLPERHEHMGIYVDNPDGVTVSYGVDKVNKIRRKYKSGEIPEDFDFDIPNNSGAYSDYITTNGGNVNRMEAPDGSVYMVDTWDLNPLQDGRSISPWVTKNIPWLKNIEASTIIGGKPFVLQHKVR